MVFIHGGGYDSGASKQYGPDFLLNHGVIVVIIAFVIRWHRRKILFV